MQFMDSHSKAIIDNKMAQTLINTGFNENDNRFYEPIGRFPEIEEDEPAYRLLCNEYPKAE